MARAKILIVDDEAGIRDMVCLALHKAGYECLDAGDVAQAQQIIREQQPDLLLLDWMLPGVSGVDFARRLRQEKLTRELPVIMLTARTEEDDKIKGLDSGADDYVTKPFSPRELIARIEAILRRTAPQAAGAPLEAAGLTLDPGTHRVYARGESLDMSPTEFRLLQFFLAHPERVHTREQLLNSVWGQNVYVEERTVDVHVRRLRKVLAKSGHDQLIQTVRGTGYRLSKQD